MAKKRKVKGRANYIPFAVAVAVIVIGVGILVGSIALSRKGSKDTDEPTTAYAESEAQTVSPPAAAESSTDAEKTTNTTAAPKTQSKTQSKTESGGSSSDGSSSSGGASSSEGGSNSVKKALSDYTATFSDVPSDGKTSKSKTSMRRGLQILVNNNYAYDTDTPQDLINLTDVSNRAFLVAYDDLDADRYTVKQFNYMNSEYYKKYSSKLTVCSGYRSYASQKRNFERSVERVGEEETLKWFTRPGRSEHHTGYAIDYNTDSFGSGAFTGKGNQSWVRENCHKYGFVLRYTADKKSITGVNAEAWHFRQVGIPHADYIMKNGLCLEEYVEKIKSYSFDSPLKVTADAGGTYYIWYVKAAGGETEINLSGYSKYTCSGNNVDGFIVTAVK